MSLRQSSIPQLQDVALRAATRINLIDRGDAPATPDARENAAVILERVSGELGRRGATVPASARQAML